MPNSSRLDPPPTITDSSIGFEMAKWFHSIYEALGPFPFKIPGYTKANLPSALIAASNTSGKEFSSLIYVRDEVGGPTVAFSDGINWRRVQNRAIVS